MSCCIKNAKPDVQRCQAVNRKGDGSDGSPVWQRCTEPPVWIATEAELSEDGHMSKMAVCDGCKQRLEQSHIRCLFSRIPQNRCRTRASGSDCLA